MERPNVSLIVIPSFLLPRHFPMQYRGEGYYPPGRKTAVTGRGVFVHFSKQLAFQLV